MKRFVLDRLAEGWTPEQISGWLRRGIEIGLQAISTETIYAFIFRAAQKVESPWRYLTRRKAKRRQRIISSQVIVETKRTNCGECDSNLQPVAPGKIGLLGTDQVRLGCELFSQSRSQFLGRDQKMIIKG